MRHHEPDDHSRIIGSYCLFGVIATGLFGTLVGDDGFFNQGFDMAMALDGS